MPFPIAPRSHGNGGNDRHAACQSVGVGLRGIEQNAHGKTANDFREIARRIVGWNDGKFRTAGALIALDMSAKTGVRQGVDAELNAVADATAAKLGRSEERRVGKECGRTGESRWSPY